MKLNFLGSGSAWVDASENYHSNMLLTVNDKNLLIDCGSTIFEALKEQNISIKDINSIFVTHNHPDHIGGLPDLAFRYYYQNFPFGSVKKELIGYEKTLECLWENVLKGQIKQYKEQTLNSFFLPNKLFNNDSFYFADTKIEIVENKHEYYNDFNYSHSLFINNQIFISGDCILHEDNLKYFKKAKTIFHDCGLIHYENNIHASYQDLCSLPLDIKNKMWLYHYTTNNGTIPLPDYKKDGFLGFVKKGQIFEF